MLGRVTESIQIVEVAPRDGLQADPADLSTAQKVELIERLIAAGHTRIEATSFVNPEAVPKMADGDAVMAAVPRSSGVSYSALALNERGVERAIAAGVDEVCGVVVATETFSQANQRATIAESIQRWRTISDTARSAGIKTAVTISAVCDALMRGGSIPTRCSTLCLIWLTRNPTSWPLPTRSAQACPAELVLCSPALRNVLPGIALRGHFHNTRNTALANIAAAIDEGVRIFDSSLGGVGGCPFAPKATGNVATEDVVYLLHEMGYDTGLDLDTLIDASTWLETQLGHGVPSLVAKAGGFPQPR